MVGNMVSFAISVKPTWGILREVLSRSRDFIEGQINNNEITEASLMTISELIENAVCYWTDAPEAPEIRLNMALDNNLIRITVTNSIRDRRDIDIVISHVTNLKKTEDPARLYIERLKELLNSPEPGGSHLGLYRIAYEGEFILDYVYQNEELSVIAERKF